MLQYPPVKVELHPTRTLSPNSRAIMPPRVILFFTNSLIHSHFYRKSYMKYINKWNHYLGTLDQYLLLGKILQFRTNTGLLMQDNSNIQQNVNLDGCFDLTSIENVTGIYTEPEVVELKNITSETMVLYTGCNINKENVLYHLNFVFSHDDKPKHHFLRYFPTPGNTFLYV